MENSIANRAADNIRILAAAMVEKAKSGHPGGAMGGADFINILYSEFLNFNPDELSWPERDRFFLDPGHMSPMLYSILHLTGNYEMDELKEFRQWGSPTPGHPEMDVERGVENTSGPLGQGHVMAVGAAIAERFLSARFGEWMKHKSYTFISDGGIQEEISQGAGRLAGYLGLNNLIMFYDSNDIQLSTGTEAVSTEDTEAKYKAWGWRVYTIDGHNAKEIRASLKAATEEKEKPVLIIGKTIMGKGCLTNEGESFEKQTSTHGQPIGAAGASFEKTIENLGGDGADPFKVFPDVAEFYKEVLDKKREAAALREAEKEKWENANPALAAKLDQFFNNDISGINLEGFEQKENIATRAAGGAVLGELAKSLGNMVVASADLSNSDKTDGFLKNTTAFAKGDFSGSFLQMGVSELTMAAVMNGMAAHGGIIPAGGTFFVFSDYMKPAVRMAALMELPVKYVWTHDAFRVGEDGPTHQPVEQEAQIRLMEHLRNHKGERSVLVLRPADADETTVAWQMAIENNSTPTALILSRQGIKSLPAMGDSRKADAAGARKGAYLVKDCGETPDLVLVASGSEVATLYAASEILEEKKEGLKINIVSAISEGLFREQDKDYQESVLPAGVKTVGLTAGLPVTLAGLVGSNGIAFGMESFGWSAPAGVLDEKFGYTGDQVAEKVLEFLG